MHIRRLIILNLLAILTTIATAQEQFDQLVIRLANGTEQWFTINETITISADADYVTFSSAHFEMKYTRNNVAGYTFKSDENVPDGIGGPTIKEQGRIQMKREGNTLHISGLCKDTKVKVYATNSMQVSPSVTYGEGTANIDLSSIPQGIFIISFTGCDSAPSVKFTNWQ